MIYKLLMERKIWHTSSSSQIDYKYICMLLIMSIIKLNTDDVLKEWILEKNEIRVNLEGTFVLFTHFGVTTGISRNPWVIPVVTPKWVNNTNVHSKFTLISLFSKIHSLKSEHIHSFLFREYHACVYIIIFIVSFLWFILFCYVLYDNCVMLQIYCNPLCLDLKSINWTYVKNTKKKHLCVWGNTGGWGWGKRLYSPPPPSHFVPSPMSCALSRQSLNIWG